VEIASNNQRPARVSLKTRFINCSSPAAHELGFDERVVLLKGVEQRLRRVDRHRSVPDELAFFFLRLRFKAAMGREFCALRLPVSNRAMKTDETKENGNEFSF